MHKFFMAYMQCHVSYVVVNVVAIVSSPETDLMQLSICSYSEQSLLLSSQFPTSLEILTPEGQPPPCYLPTESVPTDSERKWCGGCCPSRFKISRLALRESFYFAVTSTAYVIYNLFYMF